MRKLFYNNENYKNVKEIKHFLEEFKAKLIEFNVDKYLVNLLFNNLASFGPKRHGPNVLIIKLLLFFYLNYF